MTLHVSYSVHCFYLECLCVFITCSISLAQPAFCCCFGACLAEEEAKNVKSTQRNASHWGKIHSPHCCPCAESAGGSTGGSLRSAERMFYKLAVRTSPLHEGCVPQRPAKTPFFGDATTRESVQRGTCQQWQKRIPQNCTAQATDKSNGCYSKIVQQGK